MHEWETDPGDVDANKAKTRIAMIVQWPTAKAKRISLIASPASTAEAPRTSTLRRRDELVSHGRDGLRRDLLSNCDKS